MRDAAAFGTHSCSGLVFGWPCGVPRAGIIAKSDALERPYALRMGSTKL